MSLQFHWLAVQGFRSFREVQDFGLASDPGLVLVTGENLVEPDLGANGVGKSSLFEALYWVLFGKTSVNLRAGDVANWEGDPQCAVQLGFTREDVKHEVLRTWSPNVLRLDGEEVTQQRVEEVLGMSESVFLHAIFHAQFLPQFADQQPGAQLELFSEVLGLHVWEEATLLAQREAKDTNRALQAAQMKESGARAAYNEAQQQLEGLEEKEVAWWRDTMATLKEDSAALSALQTELAAAKAEPVAVAVVNQDMLDAAQDDLDKLVAKSLQASAESLRAGEHVRDLTDSQTELDGKTVCPVCKQNVSGKYVHKHIGKLLSEAQLDYASAESKAMQAQTVEQAQRTKVKSLRDEFKRTQAEAAQKNQARIDRINKLSVKVATLQGTMQRQAQVPCPYDTEASQRRCETLLAAYQEASGSVSELSVLLGHYEYWARAFREIRLALVEEALKQFEVTTNSALSMLGMSDWTIEYGVEAENKSGKIARGFNIFVHSPHNKQRVPFAAWSGGERQRLRLAITVGLSDLIQDQLGVHSNIEIYDEPTAWLSEEGVTGLLEMLDARARRNECTVYLADHRSLDSSIAASIVKLVKSEHGTTIE